MEIHHDVLSQFKRCNTGPERENALRDYDFGLAVYASVIPPNEKLSVEINAGAMAFVLGNYLHLDLHYILQYCRYFI